MRLGPAEVGVRRSGGLRAVPPWLALAVGGVAATALYALDIAALAAFAIVGVGGVLAMVVGPRWHRVEPRMPWRLLAASAALFLVGAFLRPAGADAGGTPVLIADAVTLVGFLCTIASLASFLTISKTIRRS